MGDPREVVQEYLRLLAFGDDDALDGVVASDVAVYRPDGEVAFEDRSTWKASLANEPFTDTEIIVEDMVCEGEKVVVRYRVRCIQARRFSARSQSTVVKRRRRRRSAPAAHRGARTARASPARSVRLARGR